jgi:putative transposase
MVRLLPPPIPKPKDGRSRLDDRQAMTAILYVLRTGCPWKALPRSLGAANTVHDRFQEWREARVFERLWQKGLLMYDELKGLEWEWQARDGANRHAMKLVDATLEAMMIKRPEPTATWPQPVCLDQGYDDEAVRETLEDWGYTAHMRRRGEERQAKCEIPGYRARRWVVERTHA